MQHYSVIYKKKRKKKIFIRVNSEFTNLKSQWTGMEKDYMKVVDSRRLALEAEQKLSSLQSLTTNRFLWGSLLNELQFVLAGTEGIHFTRLRGDQSFQLQAEVKAKPGKEKETPNRPAASTERIVLTIDARDASAQPGDQVTKLKATLATPMIPGASIPSTTNQVALLNISAPQSDKDTSGGSSQPYVTFTIQSTYPERIRLQ